MTGGEAAGRQGKEAAAKEAATQDAAYEAALASGLAKMRKEAEEQAKACGCAVEDIYPAVDDHEMQTLEELEDLLGVEGVDAVVDEMFDEAQAEVQGLTEAEAKALLKHRLLRQGE
jgi:hypothetical protein